LRTARVQWRPERDEIATWNGKSRSKGRGARLRPQVQFCAWSGRRVGFADVTENGYLEVQVCDLVISNTKVEGSDGVELIRFLRQRRRTLPIIYLANLGRSTPETEAQLPADIPILCEPFTVENLRGAVEAMLDGKGDAGRS
jgi:DNA-binding response OmpR family regulator